MITRYMNLSIWLLASLFGRGIAMTSWMNAEDLTSFVTRPELKVPRLMLKKYHQELVIPGYIFMAPYIRAEEEAYTKYYQPCQVGPNIYDLEGDLIWSGACIFSNRNTFDFKLNRHGDNASTISVIVDPIRKQFGSMGFATILSPSLEIKHTSKTTSDIQSSYMHEFSVLDGGNTALYIHAEYREANVTEVSQGNKTHWMVRDEGFREVDLRDGSSRFQWWAMDHIPIEETFDRPPLKDPSNPFYDPYHINSLERTAFGHYLVSMRHTNTIYMISGQDGHVMWRLGGQKSSFLHLDSLNFSAQHDARILSEQVNGTIVMSLFDNAGAGGRPKKFWTAGTSSAIIAALDTSVDPKTVRLVRRYERPDHGMTVLRGNAQVLPNGNILAGWSDGGYFSEFSENGMVAVEGRLGSSRMSTYRTFKFGIDEVRLFPAEPIALVCRTLQIGYGPQSSKMSVMYVSWNGATQVKQWKFAVAEDAEVDDAGYTTIGSKDKQGFETIAQFNQAGTFALVYALDHHGNVLGKASPVKCIDIVEAGAESHQFEDPDVSRRPPGIGAVPPSVTDWVVSHEEQDAEVVGANWKESPSATSSDGEAEKQQEQKQRPTGASHTENKPPPVIDIDRAFILNASPRHWTMFLFLISLLAVILLMMRRRIRGFICAAAWSGQACA